MGRNRTQHVIIKVVGSEKEKKEKKKKKRESQRCLTQLEFITLLFFL